jgi:hypothetical protein
MGAVLVMASTLGALLFLQLHKFASVVVYIVTIALAVHTLQSSYRKFPEASPTQQIREYVSGAALAWYRLQYQEGMKAAMLLDTRIYYGASYNVIRIWDYPALDRAITQVYTADDAIKVLQQFGFTHLIASREQIDLFFNPRILALVLAWINKHPERVLFSTPHSWVIDLQSKG